MKTTFAVLGLSLLLLGCRHPLLIVGEGDITSSDSRYGCTLEEFQAGATNCVDNVVSTEYKLTYFGDARPGWHFHRWGNYCGSRVTNDCPFPDVGAAQVAQFAGASVPPLWAIFRPDVITGHKSLFMGHSLFDPFAQGMLDYSAAAGFADHIQDTRYWPGALGAPQSIWADAGRRAQIQDILDEGDTELFGMAYHPEHTSYAGYLNWTRYALKQNPDTRFFISIAWPRNPAFYPVGEYASEWSDDWHPRAHAMIDQLRADFPGVDFYCIPLGQSAVELDGLFANGDLAVDGVTQRTRLTSSDPFHSSVFLDYRGHPDSMLLQLGRLVWLKAIYGVDLSTYTYRPPLINPEHAAFSTDLEGIAQTIVDNHDPAYSSPELQ